MNREEIFEGLKNLIIELRDNSDKFKNDPSACQEWSKKQQALGIAVKSLNSDDKLWLDNEYGKWYKVEIAPLAKDFKAPSID